jgi:predicted enzyme related to lactoylglutathione lyase
MASYVIDYFELPVSDAPRSSAFFNKAFGWSAQSFGDGYIEVRDAGVLGGLNGDAGDRPPTPVVGIRTDDIEAAQQAVVAAGGTITRAVYNYPGGRRFLFREPGGAELLVYQPSE